MNEFTFSDKGWEDYLYWQRTDKATLRKINELLKDIRRSGPAEGLSKPEPLKYRKAWSRRVDREHRLVYAVDEAGNIYILSIRGHYED